MLSFIINPAEVANGKHVPWNIGLLVTLMHFLLDFGPKCNTISCVPMNLLRHAHIWPIKAQGILYTVKDMQ